MNMKEMYNIEEIKNKIICGDAIEELKNLPDNCVDAVITDPPYALGFLGKEWDTFDKSQFGRKGLEGKNDLKVKKNFEILPRYKNWDGYYEFSFNWAKEVFRVLKPGGHLLAFGGTRTYHRMTCGIEDAGFEIRDCIMYIFGSGFPKSLNIAKSIDRLLKEGTASLNSVGDNSKGALYFHKLNFEQGYRPKDYTNVERRKYEITEDIAKKWEGWGTALKPAYEPIVVARKPLSEKNVALNVLKWGTGGLNIDGCRVGISGGVKKVNIRPNSGGFQGKGFSCDGELLKLNKGRFPANVIFECICDEVIEGKEEIVKIHDAPKGTFAGGEPNRGSIKNYRERNVGKSIIHTNPNCPCYMLDKQSGKSKSTGGRIGNKGSILNMCGTKYQKGDPGYGDFGGASRFFYCAKASRKERDMGLENLPLKKGGGMKGTEDQSLLTGSGNVRNNLMKNIHPTVKPLRLLEYLVKLVTPPGGIVLDPFAGSGTTCIACKKLGFKFIGIEKEAEYVEIARKRLEAIKENKQFELF